MNSSALAIDQWEQLIASFAAVPNPGLYDGRRLFSLWIRQFPMPDGVIIERLAPGGLPCLSVRPAAAEPTRTQLHIHGGAFASGNGSDFLALGARLALASNARVVLADYRLAPEHPYPAGPDDCWSIYQGLLADGADPARMALSGDSAGSALVLGTLVRAKNEGAPLPAAALLISPWIDLTMSCESWETVDDPSATRESMQPYIEAYLGSKTPDDPAVSPLFADLTGLPPLLVQVGAREVFVGEAEELASRAKAAGVTVELEIAAGMPHIWHFFAALIPEAQAAIERAGKFLASHMQ